MINKYVFSRYRIVQCRSYTTPTIDYARTSIVGGVNILTRSDPVMVYVEHKCNVFDQFERGFKSPFVFVVFNCDSVSRLRRKSWEDCFDTGRTLSTGYMDVALKVLEFAAEAHPSNDVNMIFKLLYTTFNNIWIVTGKHCKLSWMKTKTHIQLSC